MRRFTRSRKGFTLTEIIAAALIITIAAGGTFSAYILARHFGNKFLHKSEATRVAEAIADELRYRQSYDNDQPNSGAPVPDLSVGLHDDPTADPIIDLSTYALDDKVNNLAAEYTVADVYLDNAATEVTAVGPDARKFKKITVKISWKERKAS